MPRVLGKGLEVLHVFILGINTREMISVSKIFGVVAWQLMFDDLGDFELSVQYVSS
jgi:hypothetical protein